MTNKNGILHYAYYSPSRAEAPEYCLHADSEEDVERLESARLKMVQEIMKIADATKDENSKQLLLNLARKYNCWTNDINDLVDAELRCEDDEDE